MYELYEFTIENQMNYKLLGRRKFYLFVYYNNRIMHAILFKKWWIKFVTYWFYKEDIISELLQKYYKLEYL